ncbi:DUF1398 family protein, partial [Escherichia coli]
MLVESGKSQSTIRYTDCQHQKLLCDYYIGEYCSTLAGAGVFRWVTDVNHNKRSYYAIDNTLLYIE